MNSSSSRLAAQSRTFSHIYVEREALSYPLAQDILNANCSSVQIIIDHYKDVFCRPGQNFVRQKAGPKLILAVNQKVELYKGSALCDSFGHENFLYVSHVMNCLYDCEYCYLAGMYPSANVVIFVNVEDYLDKLEKALPAYVCVSYDTDLLALESMTGILVKWIRFCAAHKDAAIEIRTKSGNYKSIKHLSPVENVVLAWTLSPEQIIERYEHGTPSLQTRLQCIRAAILDGWRVRLCIDPILCTAGSDWETVYQDACRDIVEVLDGVKPVSVSLGTFRVSKDFYKRMKRLRPESALLSFPFENRDGIMRYNRELEMRMLEVLNEVFRNVMKI